MDQGLLDLATLAEHVVGRGSGLHVAAGRPTSQGREARRDWVPVFAATQVLRDKLAGNDRSKATAIGMFLAARSTARSPIETADGPRMATLRAARRRPGQKLYFFEIGADPPTERRPSEPGPTSPSP